MIIIAHNTLSYSEGMEKSHSVCYVIWQYNNHIKKFFNEDCIDDTYNTVFKDISGFMDGREGELMHLYKISFKLWSMSCC